MMEAWCSTKRGIDEEVVGRPVVSTHKSELPSHPKSLQFYQKIDEIALQLVRLVRTGTNAIHSLHLVDFWYRARSTCKNLTRASV